MITIIDYGLGNVQALANIYKKLDIPVTLAHDEAGLRGARKVILPGVGAFDWAMALLNGSGMREPLEALVRAELCDVIGICVGMQMLAERSEEGSLPGLGWIRGDVKRFDEKRFSEKTHLPHMGWNDVAPQVDSGLFRGIGDEARFYFLHSYYFVPSSKEDLVATSDYGGSFACAVRNGNVYGVQFHPEKSHQWGIQLLHNFALL